MDLFPAPDPNQSEKWYPDPDQNILDPPHCQELILSPFAGSPEEAGVGDQH